MNWDKTTRIIYSILACSVVATLYLLVGPNHKEDPVPKQLWGYWTTDAQGYENRYLELDDRYILIGVNENDLPDLQRVSRVDCHTVGAQITCTLYSSNAATNFRLTLDYDPTNGGQIHIKNQQGIVWKRQPSS